MIRRMRIRVLSLALLSASLILCACSDEDEERNAPQNAPPTIPRPVRSDSITAPQGLPTGPRFELYSAYSGQDIKQVTGVSGRTLWLCFTAPWCPHSRDMIRELKLMAQEEKGSVQVVEVNADAYPALAEQFNITKVPTTVLYTEGVKLRTIEGAYNAASLQRYLHKVLSREEDEQPAQKSLP